MSHQYLVTEPLLLTPPVGPRATPLPTLRDPDLLVYWRQEVDGLLMGGYERDPEPWTASATTYDAVPADFNGRLLREDWDRFEQIAENSPVRVPAMAEVGVRKLINGPEAFTPDNEFCLGETEVGGFFVAAGFCAHGIAGAGGIGQVMAEWILDGEPSSTSGTWTSAASARAVPSPSVHTGPHGRELRDLLRHRLPEAGSAGRPAVADLAGLSLARRARSVFGEKAGWERVNYYELERRLPRDEADAAGRLGRAQLVARDRGRAPRPPARRPRCSTRRRSPRSRSRGPDAAPFLERVCDNAVARGDRHGDLHPAAEPPRRHRGRLHRHPRRGRRRSGSSPGRRSARTTWPGCAGRPGVGTARSVRIDDITGQYVCFALWGPRAREILAR